MGIRRWYIVGEDDWYMVGANPWYIVGEDRWYMVAANSWYMIAEEYWYIVARGLTPAIGRIWIARQEGVFFVVEDERNVSLPPTRIVKSCTFPSVFQQIESR